MLVSVFNLFSCSFVCHCQCVFVSAVSQCVCFGSLRVHWLVSVGSPGSQRVVVWSLVSQCVFAGVCA